MKRRNSVELIVLAGAAIAFGSPVEAASPQATGAKPNILLILLILIDDIGWKDVGYAGSRYYQTPHIDALASEGMKFSNAYSAAPVCSPSRGAIFSGKNPARTQLTAVWDGPAGPDDRLYDQSKYRGDKNQYLEARSRRALPKTESTLGQALAEAGYQTGFFGKWHIGECPGYYPDDRGSQVAKGYRIKKVGTSKSGHWMRTFHEFAANLEGVDKDAYLADVLTDECIDFIEQNKDKPWFAVLSHYLVHDPIQPKPEKLARYKNKPKTDQGNPGMAAMIESVDESVGRLTQALKALGLDQDTLVIFTSDNGGLTPGNTSNYPLMGGKSFPFEAGMKVPFIAKWPKAIRPGSTSAERIVGMDIYPTVLSAAGLPMRPAQHVDGLDLMPIFSANPPPEQRSIVFHYPHYTHATGPFSIVIRNNWKLIRFYNDKHGAHLLYNLHDDPEEQNNLAGKNAELRDQLQSQLNDALLEMKAEMPISNPRYATGQGGGDYDLKSTLDLATKERLRFESRLKE